MSQPVLNISLLLESQQHHSMREMDIIWKLCRDCYPFKEGSWFYVCSWLVTYDLLVMFMLSKICVSLECALATHSIETLNISYKSKKKSKSTHKMKKKMISKSTDLNKCSFFFNQYSTNSTKYGQKTSMS